MKWKINTQFKFSHTRQKLMKFNFLIFVLFLGKTDFWCFRTITHTHTHWLIQTHTSMPAHPHIYLVRRPFCFHGFWPLLSAFVFRSFPFDGHTPTHNNFSFSFKPLAGNKKISRMPENASKYFRFHFRFLANVKKCLTAACQPRGGGFVVGVVSDVISSDIIFYATFSPCLRLSLFIWLPCPSIFIVSCLSFYFAFFVLYGYYFYYFFVP